GREVEIRAILERLRSAAFVVIAGASGLGKSSLSRAGVIPRLCEGALDERRWSSATLTPGKKPIFSFATALAPYLGVDEEMLAQVIERDNQDVYRQLRRRVKVRGPLVLFIDQLEELVTLSNEVERAIVIQMLEAFSAPCQSLRVLATVRADFLV